MTDKIPSRFLLRVLALCVLAFTFGMAVYRAKTQTIAHDEAHKYEWFLDGGVGHVLAYNPANHVLFTLFAEPIVWSLGPPRTHSAFSESLRNRHLSARNLSAPQKTLRPGRAALPLGRHSLFESSNPRFHARCPRIHV